MDRAYQLHDGDFQAGPFHKAASTLFPGLVRALRRAGYEEVLAVRGCAHVALWLNVIISFGFVAFWLVDVFTLRCCFAAQANKIAPIGTKCVVEAFGLLIFFASFRDAIRMIAHFDNHRQDLLKKKWRVLEQLDLESQQVLRAAKANVDYLREKVLRMMGEHIASYVMEVFTIILPNLEEQEVGKALLQTLSARLKGVLQDVLDLGEAMLSEQVQKHPQVYQRLEARRDRGREALLLWDAWTQVAFPDVFVERRSFGKKRRSSNASALVATLQSAPSTLSQATRRKSASVQDTGRVAAVLSKEALGPVEELLEMPNRFERLRREILSGSFTPQHRGQRIGIGTPPRTEDEVARCCCMPRCIAITGRAVAAMFCWCGGALDPGFCARGLSYDPPKLLQLGFVWLRIHSKMHERLIQGLVFGVAYLLLYAWLLDLIFEDPNCHFGDWIVDNCAVDATKKVACMLALMCYIPALAICLYNIERLDAVGEAMETIWELEDMQLAIRSFNQRMEEVAEHVVLLQAVEDRALTRIGLAMQFGRRVGVLVQPQVAGGPAMLKEAANQFSDALGQTAAELGPATVWLRLPPSGREAKVAAVRRRLEALGRRHFEAAPAPAPAPAQEQPEQEQERPGAWPRKASLSSSGNVELSWVQADRSSQSTLNAPDMPDGTFVQPRDGALDGV